MGRVFSKVLMGVTILLFCIGGISTVAHSHKLPGKIKKKALDYLDIGEPLYITVSNGILPEPGSLNYYWAIGYLIPQGYIEDRGEDGYIVTSKTVNLDGYKEDYEIKWFIPLSARKVRQSYIPIAKRVFKSINYVNHWYPNDIETWSFTFSYTIEPILPGLPVRGPFEGKASVYRDPRTGKWIIDEFYTKRGDSGIAEYDAWITKRGKKAEQERQKYLEEHMRIKSLRYSYKKERVRFYFDIEGGRSPYKIFVNINGQDLKRFFNRYKIEEGKGVQKELYYCFERYGYYGGDTTFRQGEPTKKINHYFDIAVCRYLKKFAWPPDIRFPIHIGIKVEDSKGLVSEREIIVKDGPHDIKSPILIEDKYRYIWVVIDGKKYGSLKPIDLTGEWRMYQEISGTFKKYTYYSLCKIKQTGSSFTSKICTITKSYDWDTREEKELNEKKFKNGTSQMISRLAEIWNKGSSGKIEGKVNGRIIELKIQFKGWKRPCIYKGIIDPDGNFMESEHSFEYGTFWMKRVDTQKEEKLPDEAIR